MTLAHDVDGISVSEAWAIFLLLAARNDSRRQRAARRLVDRAAIEQAAAKKLREELSIELTHVALGNQQAADRAAVMLEQAGFTGALRELRERREADGYRISDDR
jgi:hypothetical protein